MPATKIELVRYKNRKMYAHIDKASVGFMPLTEIWDDIRLGAEIVSFDNRDGTDYTLEDAYMSMLQAAEPKAGDISLLNRIIRGGGLIEYTSLLEFSK